MSEPRLYTWERDDELTGHSMGRVEQIERGWLLHGAEVTVGDSPVACFFRLRVDEDWLTRSAEITAIDRGGQRSVEITSDGEGHWQVDGVPAPRLDGIVDLDIAATPLTNTLVLRRLGEHPTGHPITLQVAWVDVPSLVVGPVEQTYTRQSAAAGFDAWEYRDEEHGAFVLTVDAEGVAVDYRGLARRTSPRPS